MKMARAFAWLSLSGLTAALTIWTYVWLHAFSHDVKEVTLCGFPTTSIGVVAVILLLNYLRRSDGFTASHHDAVARASIKPVLGGLLSIMSGLIGGVIVNPVVLTFVFRIHWNLETMVLLFAPSMACGAMAVVGGLFAMKRRRYMIALAGSIMAIPSLVFAGVPALVLVATSRDEFRNSGTAGPQMGGAEDVDAEKRP